MGWSDHRDQVREFLSSRRARITPAQAGLPAYGGKRRVTGLRREEVALLAGISAEYYIRFERGRAAGASAGVVDTVAAALQLSDVEREHLDHLLDSLSTAGRSAPPRRRPARGSAEPDTVRPAVQVLLDSITELPAFVFNRRLDIVATNRPARLLYEPMYDEHGRANTARFLFRHARGREFWPNWEQMADDVVAVLRAEAGRDPNHPGLVELIGQLSTRSEEFRRRWAAHDVHEHQSGSKTLCHPVIGRVTLPFETLYLAEDTDVHLMTYTPEPGSPAHDALRLLSSWGLRPCPMTPGAATMRTRMSSPARRPAAPTTPAQPVTEPAAGRGRGTATAGCTRTDKESAVQGRTLQEAAHERAQNLPAVALEQPFGPDWEVYKVGGKVFMLLTDVPRQSRVRDGQVVAGQSVVIVKADPSDAAALREAHADITPGYHLNKRHWITLGPGGSLARNQVEELVTDSYRIVLDTLPRNRRPVRPETVGT